MEHKIIQGSFWEEKQRQGQNKTLFLGIISLNISAFPQGGGCGKQYITISYSCMVSFCYRKAKQIALIKWIKSCQLILFQFSYIFSQRLRLDTFIYSHLNWMGTYRLFQDGEAALPLTKYSFKKFYFCDCNMKYKNRFQFSQSALLTLS